MSLYNPFTYFKETARLLFQKRVKDGQLAFLGDSDGTGARVEVPDAPGYVYARFQNVPDANGNATFSAPFLVRSGNAAFQNYPGASVYVAVGYNGELEIVSANYQELTRNGIDTRTLNPLHQQSKWVYLFQLTIGLCSAVANSVNGSFLVTVKKYRHYVNNIFQTFETGAQADKIDLAPYIPAVDMHCYAAVWVDTYANTAHVTTSTAQSLFTTLDDTDIQECVVERPPDAIPHKLFYLSNNQGTVTQQAAKDVDVRQFLNTPAVHGFPNPVAYRERIHPDRQVLFAGSLVVTGSLQVLGSLIGVPTVASSGGGSGGMTSFDVAADTGTPATIVDGDELEIAGDGTTIETSIAAKVVTIGLTQEAIVKLCDLRMSHDVQLPYYAGITDENELLCAPIKSGMVSLPVAGIWRYFEVAGITTPIEAANTETGDVTSGSTVITNMSYTRSLAPGMTISGTGINAAATISTVDSATQITMSHTASATNTGVTLTFEFPADQMYDVFLVYDSGLATVVPFYRKWQAASSRSLMTQVNGIWLSDADTDARWIGAIRVPTNQLFQRSPLQCFISNLDHPFPHPMRVVDTTDSWSYNGGWRQARAQTANRVEFIACMWNFTYSFRLLHYSSGSGVIGYGGIGLNSTTAPTNNIGRQGSSSTSQITAPVLLEGDATAGYTAVNWLEKSAVGAVTFYGDNAQTDGMQSGLSGFVMA